MRASGGGSRVTQLLSCLRFGAHGRYVNELEHHGYWSFIRPWCCGGGTSLESASIRRVTGSSARQVRMGRGWEGDWDWLGGVPYAG